MSTPPLDRIETAILRAAEELLHADGSIILRDEAVVLADRLAVDDPDGWDAWIAVAVHAEIRERLRSHLRRMRTEAMRTTRRSVFENYASQVRAATEAGDDIPDPLEARFSSPIRQNAWMRLGDMTRPDLIAIANARRQQAYANARTALWFRALATMLPDDATPLRQVATGDDVRDLYADAVCADVTEITEPDNERMQR